MDEDNVLSNPIASRILIMSSRRHIPIFGRCLRIILGSDFYLKEFGPGLFIPHPYGIVVHSAVKVGSNVSIFQGVTIGGSRAGSGVPVIGDNVYIGAGAKLLGGIAVGNNVNIGANAVVTKDVPDNTTVVGANVHLPRTTDPNRPNAANEVWSDS